MRYPKFKKIQRPPIKVNLKLDDYQKVKKEQGNIYKGLKTRVKNTDYLKYTKN